MCPRVDEKVLNFKSIISSKIQVYYLKKCCEIFFFIFKFYATFFEGFMKTNLEPGPKRVQSGPKTVQRKRDPGPKLVQCGSNHVQTGPIPVQAHFHIIQ